LSGADGHRESDPKKSFGRTPAAKPRPFLTCRAITEG
jgi:hypothetical protein